MSKRILITGGAGFIGSHMTRHFAEHAEVTVLDDLRSGYVRNLEGVRCRLLQGSILDQASLSQAIVGADEVYHLAAMISVPESVAKPAECAELNTEGTPTRARRGPRRWHPQGRAGLFSRHLWRQPDGTEVGVNAPRAEISLRRD